jgi:hypothetical protein
VKPTISAANTAMKEDGGKKGTGKEKVAAGGEGKVAGTESSDGDSGSLVPLMLLLIVAGVTGVTVHTAYASQDVQFAQMPADVQTWLETGQYVVVALSSLFHRKPVWLSRGMSEMRRHQCSDRGHG